MSTAQKCRRAHCSTTSLPKDETVKKKHKEEEGRFCNQSPWDEDDTIYPPPLRQWCRLHGLGKLYHCDAPFSELMREDHDTQRLCINHGYV